MKIFREIRFRSEYRPVCLPMSCLSFQDVVQLTTFAAERGDLSPEIKNYIPSMESNPDRDLPFCKASRLPQRLKDRSDTGYIVVTVPNNSLNRFYSTKIVGDYGQYLLEWRESKENSILDAWIEDGCPLEWNPESEPTKEQD